MERGLVVAPLVAKLAQGDTDLQVIGYSRPNLGPDGNIGTAQRAAVGLLHVDDLRTARDGRSRLGRRAHAHQQDRHVHLARFVVTISWPPARGSNRCPA